MNLTNTYQKRNNWGENCPQCGIITYFRNQEQRDRRWVGQCYKCAWLSGEWKFNFDPKIKSLTMKKILLLQYGLTINSKGKITQIPKKNDHE